MAGIIAGFFYWKYIGCLSGACPLQSSLWVNLLLGALIGYTIADTLRTLPEKS
ncbi:MAG TPA: DUF6132 family protein [bacterium]|nr:DUF6132 family protein [bacterium]